MKLSARTKMITKKMLKKSKMDNKYDGNDSEGAMETSTEKQTGLFENLRKKKKK